MAVTNYYSVTCEWCEKEGQRTLKKNPSKDGLPDKELPYHDTPFPIYDYYNQYVKYKDNPERAAYKEWSYLGLDRENRVKVKGKTIFHKPHYIYNYEHKYIFFCSERCEKEWRRTAKLTRDIAGWKYNV